MDKKKRLHNKLKKKSRSIYRILLQYNSYSTTLTTEVIQTKKNRNKTNRKLNSLVVFYIYINYIINNSHKIIVKKNWPIFKFLEMPKQFCGNKQHTHSIFIIQNTYTYSYFYFTLNYFILLLLLLLVLVTIGDISLITQHISSSSDTIEETIDFFFSLVLFFYFLSFFFIFFLIFFVDCSDQKKQTFLKFISSSSFFLE